MDLNARAFFDLSAFAHALLFKEGEPVWEALKRLESYLKSLPMGVIEGQVDSGAYLVNPAEISIGPGTVVEAGAYIRGPCVIGANCQIRHGAYIRGQLLAGNGCVIGHATEVKHAIFFDGAQAGHFAYVGDSILGNHVNLGAGTKCANLRLDNAEVTIRIDSERIKTGLRKFGAIIGDHGELGCNSVTNPGTIMGKSCRLFPCMNTGGFIPAGSTVRSELPALITSSH